jgi:glutamine---fructose-6-phosphate transaminase (isomerizing)
VAAVKEGTLTIHRIRRNMDDPNAREITIIKMEIQQIMKGVTKNPPEYTN